MGQNINILLASSKYMPEYSGSGLRAHNLYKRLADKHKAIFSPIVLSGSETENQSRRYEYDGFTVNRIAGKCFVKLSCNPFVRRFQIWRNFRSEFKLGADFLNALSPMPDLVHIFGKSYITSAALHYAISHSIPVLIELCNEMSSSAFHVPFPSKIFSSLTPRSSFKYVCISKRLKKVCLADGIAEEAIWCRPNPVDETKFFPVSAGIKSNIRRRITGWSNDICLLSYVAKLIPRKNHMMLIDVMERLPSNFKLFMGGPTVPSGIEFHRDSQLISELQQEISRRNLSSRIILKTGFFDNIDDFYKMSDIYLFPTKEEGLGTPLLEAIACGIPVVANTISGITDTWIEDGVNGFLSFIDPDDFASKILRASEIPRGKMLESSGKILRTAGTKAIDKEYMTLINKMVKFRQ